MQPTGGNERPSFTNPTRAPPPFTRPPFSSGSPAPGAPNFPPGPFTSGAPGAPPVIQSQSPFASAPGARPVVQSQSPFASAPPAPGAPPVIQSQSPFASGPPAPGVPPVVQSQPPFASGPPAPGGPRFGPPAQPVTPLQGPYMRGPPAAPMGAPSQQQPLTVSSPRSPLQQQNLQGGFANMPPPRPFYQPPPVQMGPPAQMQFGPPPTAQSQFGPPPTAQSQFGPRSTSQSQFGPPSTAQSQFGPPPQAGPTSQLQYGPPPTAQLQYGPPQMGPTSQYGPPQVGPPTSQLQYGPPLVGPTGSALNALVEDFQSLTVGSVPGSADSGVDQSTLPRPLKGDELPTRVLESFPLNCHPRYFRLTTHAVPNAQSLLARWHLPLGAVVHPLAECPDGEEVPVLNFGSAGVIRCRRCRTYINPYIQFADSGRKWRCNLCQLLNDVPAEYYCALDQNGRRFDLDHRPELTKGTVDFLAPTEYMVRPPMPPCYFFIIDVSVASVQCGLLEVVAKTIKSCLDELPGYPRTQIGFITYDSALHFHNLKSSLSQPQMMVVPDLEDIFLPLPDDLLVNLSESRQVVESFLDSLPAMFQNNMNVESALGPALKAAYMVMGQIGGKLLVFQSNLPSIGIGRLRLRGDDIRVYGTDKEHQLRIPEDPYYKQMAAEFTKNQIAVDIFAFGSKYCDIASLGALAKYTGGQVYYYPQFDITTHGDKLRYELARDLTRETAWESVMRVRCGKGVRFTTYHGHFMLRSTDLLALPAVDADKAFAMQLSLEETIMTTQTVYFQVALLYTSSSGERRIRVHTAAAPVVPDLNEMYRHADTGAIISLLSRIAVETTLSTKLEDARQMLQLKLIKSLKEYRNIHAVQHRLTGRLVYPESLKYLVIYILALVKSSALRGGYLEVSLDGRSAAMCNFLVMDIGSLLRVIYPEVYRIDEVLIKPSQKENTEEEMTQIPLTTQCLDIRGIYLLNNGLYFVIWLGRNVPSELINKIFGLNLSTFPDLSKLQLVENESEVSKKLMRIISNLRRRNTWCHQIVHIIRQGEQPRESMLLLNNLIEDQLAGTPSYLDWVLQIHRQTQGS